MSPRGCQVGVVCLFAWGCLHAPPAPERSDEAEAKKLARLADEYWQFHLRQNPLLATYLGDRRFDEELPDLSEEAHTDSLERTRELFANVKLVNERRLSERDRVTRDALLDALNASLATEVCHLPWWNVNPLDGVQETLAELPETHSITRPEHARSLELRYLRAGVMLDQHVDNLRRGQKKGYLAPKIAVEHVIAQLEQMLADGAENSAFVARVQLPREWRDEQQKEVHKHLAEAVRSGLQPALRRYLDFLKAEYLPTARSEPGVEANTDGDDCYLARIRAFTGLPLRPKEIHQIGLKELEKDDAQMREVAKKLTGRDDVKALEDKLRADPAEHVATPKDLLDYDRRIVERAQAMLPRLLGRRPARAVQLKALEAFREQTAPAAYYEEGDWDGTRPGCYYVNTYQTSERLLFQREALAFHEAVPGHHVQLTLAQEMRGLPAFRRELGQPAFVEGWAHYAELLADEQGLYSSEQARFGMLSDQALRSARLVVDTGLHAMGWTREEAIQFMLDHTAESPDECTREVDRYIVWPGQALAYKLGQLEILKLRSEAMEALGPKFDLKAFHDEVLANGAVPMAVLRREVTQWIDEHPGARQGEVAR